MGGTLQFCFPRGFWNESLAVAPATMEPLTYGLNSSQVWAVAEHRQQFTGDFDVTVDFTGYQGKTGWGTTTAALYVSPDPFEQTTLSSPTYACIALNNTPEYQGQVVVSGTTEANSTASTTDTAGKFRIARSGSTITLYYWNATNGSWSSLGSYGSYSTAASYVALYFMCESSAGAVGFQNFGYTSASTIYPASGTYTSSVFDAGQSVTWNTLSWTATLPTNTRMNPLRGFGATRLIPNSRLRWMS